MAAEHVWSVLCRLAIFDQNEMISLIEVVDRVSLPPDEVAKADQLLISKGEPVNVHLEAVLVSRWTRSDPDQEERAEGRVRLQFPDGRFFAKDNRFEIAMEGPIINCQPRMVLRLFPYVGLGRYYFVIQQRSGPKGRWKTVARARFEIRQLES